MLNSSWGISEMRLSLVVCTLVFSTVAFAQDGFFQIGYAANLSIGDSVVNISNDGTSIGVFGAVLSNTAGNLCVNTYVFDPQEEEIGCCSCLVTPNGLNSLSVKSDLISNNLTPAVPTSVVIKLVSSIPAPATAAAGAPLTVCNPATVNAANTAAVVPGTFFSTIGVAGGMVAWGTTLEPNSTPGTYNAVNVPFLNGAFSGTPPILICAPGACGVIAPGTGSLANPPDPGSELAGLTQLCNFIQANGTGFGICKSCRLGALGGAKQ
jgi:hypothetical protein